jgi:hypothetical protein
MKIHAIQTGTVAITTKWRKGIGHGRRRLLNTVLDREWTEPLPIYAFAIEHPEAYAGATPTVYLPSHDPRNRRSARRAADRRSGRAEGGRVTRLTTSVRIGCPLDEVFAFVSEPLNFPRWNSAVRAVRKTRGRDGEMGSTYTMERELPRGSVQNELEVFARRLPIEFGIRTTSGPTPFSYRYRFSTANGQALVELDAVLELDGPAALLGPLAGRAVKRGVDDNFAELKRILEAPVP